MTDWVEEQGLPEIAERATQATKRVHETTPGTGPHWLACNQASDARAEFESEITSDVVERLISERKDRGDKLEEAVGLLRKMQVTCARWAAVAHGARSITSRDPGLYECTNVYHEETRAFLSTLEETG